MPPATLNTERSRPVPPPIPAEARERRKTAPPTRMATSSQPNATIPLNLEDLMLELANPEVDSGASEEDSGASEVEADIAKHAP